MQAVHLATSQPVAQSRRQRRHGRTASGLLAAKVTIRAPPAIQTMSQAPEMAGVAFLRAMRAKTTTIAARDPFQIPSLTAIGMVVWPRSLQTQDSAAMLAHLARSALQRNMLSFCGVKISSHVTRTQTAFGDTRHYVARVPAHPA
jgi:hypothetical protein